MKHSLKCLLSLAALMTGCGLTDLLGSDGGFDGGVAVDGGRAVDAGCGEACDDPEPDERSEQAVCARWAADHFEVLPEWEAVDGTACDLGAVPEAAHANAVRRVNLYRWLVGLSPVTVLEAQLEAQQECAALLYAINRLDHHPEEGEACYTPAGAEAAGQSNLANGWSLADTVDLYVADPGESNGDLGHRRWLMNPMMGKTAFGYKEDFSCMYAWDTSEDHTVDFVAWPPPGFVPEAAAVGRYSVHLDELQPGPDFFIEVAIDDGAFEPVAFRELAPNYGGWNIRAYSYDPPGGEALWQAGRRLRVALRGLENSDDRVFESHFTACD